MRWERTREPQPTPEAALSRLASTLAPRLETCDTSFMQIPVSLMIVLVAGWAGFLYVQPSTSLVAIRRPDLRQIVSPVLNRAADQCIR